MPNVVRMKSYNYDWANKETSPLVSGFKTASKTALIKNTIKTTTKRKFFYPLS